MDARPSGTASSRAYFEQQREALIGDIAEACFSPFVHAIVLVTI